MRVHFLVGSAADIILWRDKTVSASIVAAATAAWFLFEVAEYHFFSLLCYAAMIGMLVFFIWTNAASFFNLYKRSRSFSFTVQLHLAAHAMNGPCRSLGQ